MPRAKHLRKERDGRWVYAPPTRAVRNGIVSYWTEEEGQKARRRAERDNKKIDQWKKGELKSEVLDEISNLSQVRSHYEGTSHYLAKSASTQRTYKHLFNKVCESFGNLSLAKIDTFKCQKVYDDWVRESLPNSKMKVRAFSILINHAISLGLVGSNPMAHVKKVSHRVENRTWTKEEVEKFIDTAFSKWEWRNIGLLVLLCYEYGQRPIDIARLKWDNVDFDTDTITIQQSKRGATVYLPMDEQIRGLLLSQYQDFKFQEWVLPELRQYDGAYRPYNNAKFAKMVKEVVEEAGLPEDLKVGKLRNTAIGEMVDAGVDSTQIMQVSGHANINSLNPYLKNTREGASAALDRRKRNK